MPAQEKCRCTTNVDVIWWSLFNSREISVAQFLQLGAFSIRMCSSLLQRHQFHIRLTGNIPCEVSYLWVICIQGNFRTHKSLGNKTWAWYLGQSQVFLPSFYFQQVYCLQVCFLSCIFYWPLINILHLIILLIRVRSTFLH